MIKHIFLLFIFVFSTLLSCAARNFSTIGKWSNDDNANILVYKSSEKIIGSNSKVKAIYHKNDNKLLVFLIVNDVSMHDYIWNTQNNNSLKYNIINIKYRYTSGLNNFNNYELNDTLSYKPLGIFMQESFYIHLDLNKINEQYIVFDYEDKVNNVIRNIKIPLIGLNTKLNYNN